MYNYFGQGGDFGVSRGGITKLPAIEWGYMYISAKKRHLINKLQIVGQRRREDIVRCA